MILWKPIIQIILRVFGTTKRKNNATKKDHWRQKKHRRKEDSSAAERKGNFRKELDQEK